MQRPLNEPIQVDEVRFLAFSEPAEQYVGNRVLTVEHQAQPPIKPVERMIECTPHQSELYKVLWSHSSNPFMKIRHGNLALNNNFLSSWVE